MYQMKATKYVPQYKMHSWNILPLLSELQVQDLI